MAEDVEPIAIRYPDEGFQKSGRFGSVVAGGDDPGGSRGPRLARKLSGRREIFSGVFGTVGRGAEGLMVCGPAGSTINHPPTLFDEGGTGTSNGDHVTGDCRLTGVTKQNINIARMFGK